MFSICAGLVGSATSEPCSSSRVATVLLRLRVMSSNVFWELSLSSSCRVCLFCSTLPRVPSTIMLNRMERAKSRNV